MSDSEQKCKAADQLCNLVYFVRAWVTAFAIVHKKWNLTTTIMHTWCHYCSCGSVRAILSGGFRLCGVVWGLALDRQLLPYNTVHTYTIAHSNACPSHLHTYMLSHLQPLLHQLEQMPSVRNVAHNTFIQEEWSEFTTLFFTEGLIDP